MADGRHFENHVPIYQPQIVRIARNLVCRHKFAAGDGNDKKNQKFKMVNGRRIETHFLAITQLRILSH